MKLKYTETDLNFLSERRGDTLMMNDSDRLFWRREYKLIPGDMFADEPGIMNERARERASGGGLDYWHKLGKKKGLSFLLFYCFTQREHKQKEPVDSCLCFPSGVLKSRRRSVAVSQMGPARAGGNKAIGGWAALPVDRGPASAGVMKSWRTADIEPLVPGKHRDGWCEEGPEMQSWGQLNLSADWARRWTHVDCSAPVDMRGKRCCRTAACAGSGGRVQI